MTETFTAIYVVKDVKPIFSQGKLISVFADLGAGAMTNVSTFLRRALLYVPGSSQRMLEKSLALNVDSVIYDLEDSVLPSVKSAARSLVAKHVSALNLQRNSIPLPEVAVRINAISTGLALDDISELVRGGNENLDTIVLPKVESEPDLHFVSNVVKHLAPPRSGAAHMGNTNDEKRQKPLSIVALIESARGLCEVQSICRAGRDLGILSGVAFAAEDFAADLCLSSLSDRRELLFARSSIVAAARAYGVPSVIDLVSTVIPTDRQRSEQLTEESVEGRALGFTGKQCIHPGQVDVVQKAFGPSDKDLEWAVRVDVGDAAARKEGRGAWRLDGKMVDAPVLKRARDLLHRAEQCAIDVSEIRGRIDVGI